MMLGPIHRQQQPAARLNGPSFDAALTEFTACAMSAAIGEMDNLHRALIFAATARACGPFAPTAARPRPVSVNALAGSLARPFETTRRQVNSLLVDGLLVRDDAGLSVPIQVIADPRAAAFADRCHDLLVRMIEDLHAANVELPTHRDVPTYDPRSGVGIAFDLLLAAVEHLGERQERNWTRLSLLVAVEWSNRRFARSDSFGPTATKASTVARVLGLPYATTSRNLDILVVAGKLQRTNDGFLISPGALESEIALEGRLALSNRARQLLGRMSTLGFPFSRPQLGYIGIRPPYPTLG